MNRYVYIYLILINSAAFCCMGLDKLRAVKGEWRISERSLFLLAAAGGSAGALAGMFLFRHKTKHMSFRIGLPLILLLQLAAALWFLSRSVR